MVTVCMDCKALEVVDPVTGGTAWVPAEFVVELPPKDQVSHGCCPDCFTARKYAMAAERLERQRREQLAQAV